MTKKNTIFMSGGQSSNSGNNVTWNPFTNNVSTTEARGQATARNTMVLKTFNATVDTNGKDGDSIISYRDDSVSIESLTIGAGLTGQFLSGEINHLINSGSDISIQKDTSASTTGSLEYSGNAYCEIQS